MIFPACTLPEFLKIPVTQQTNIVLILTCLIIISSNPSKSQSFSSSPTNDISNSPDSANSFQPSVAVVIGVLAIMFSLTFLLLVYAKCCHRPASPRYLNQENFGVLPRSVSRASGIDKTVIESLPFFRFSSLKGWRDGLECSICLSRFEDVEILRLLPKCKHAFHIDCVDRWLEKHSGCPLCRCKVSEEDATLFAYSRSFRFLTNGSAREGSNLELFVEREGSARFGSRRSVQKIEEENDQEIFEDEAILHKFNHRIIISDYEHDLMGKNRWSSLSSSDLLFLKSEMINSLSSNYLQDDQQTVASISINSFDRYHPVKTGLIGHNHDHDHQVIKIKDEIKRKREFEKKIKKFPSQEPGIGSSKELKSAKLREKRSMSEIIVHPRFLGVETSNKEAHLGDEISAKEERLKRLWLPIARRTIQWFANREQQPITNTRSQI